MHRDLARDEFRRQLGRTKPGRLVLLLEKLGPEGVVVDGVDPKAFEFALTGRSSVSRITDRREPNKRVASYAVKKLLQRTAGENGRPTLPQVTDEAVNDLADAAMQARKRYFVVSAESDFTRYVLQDIDTARRAHGRRKLGDRARFGRFVVDSFDSPTIRGMASSATRSRVSRCADPGARLSDAR